MDNLRIIKMIHTIKAFKKICPAIMIVCIVLFLYGVYVFAESIIAGCIQMQMIDKILGIELLFLVFATIHLTNKIISFYEDEIEKMNATKGISQ